VLGIAGLYLLLLSSLGESNGENTEDISVVGLNVTLAFNGGLPFSNHGAELVSSNIHSVESGLGGSTFNFINN